MGYNAAPAPRRPQHVYCYFAHALHALRRVPADRARLRDEAALRRAGYRPSAELWPDGRAARRTLPLRGWLAEAVQAGEHCDANASDPP